MTNDMRTLSGTEIDAVAGGFGPGMVLLGFGAGVVVGVELGAIAALLGAGAKLAYDYAQERGNTGTNGQSVNTSLAEVIEGGQNPEGNGGNM